MKKIHMLVATAIAFAMVSTGPTAAAQNEEQANSSPTTETEGVPGMKGGMHDKGMMHHGMMGHHMMRYGMSPVTVVVHPGMMPMMGHGMMQHGTQQGAEHGHKSRMNQEKMEERHSMMKKHMERMEQRLANIEALLGELVELQKQD